MHVQAARSGVPLTVKRTGKPPDLAKKARALGYKLAGEIRKIVVARVAAGLDIHDRPFAPYVPSYAEDNPGPVDLNRNAVAQPRKGKRPGKANALMARLVITVTNRGDDVVITLKADAAHAAVGSYLHKGTPTMSPRPWLGLSPRDLIVLRGRR